MNSTYLIRMTALVASSIAIVGCDIDQTQEAELPDVDVRADAGQLPKWKLTQTQDGELPEVDVDARGGQMPKFDVEVADVDVGSKTVEVKVPTVDVDMPEYEDDYPEKD